MADSRISQQEYYKRTSNEVLSLRNRFRSFIYSFTGNANNPSGLADEYFYTYFIVWIENDLRCGREGDDLSIIWDHWRVMLAPYILLAAYSEYEEYPDRYLPRLAQVDPENSRRLPLLPAGDWYGSDSTMDLASLIYNIWCLPGMSDPGFGN